MKKKSEDYSESSRPYTTPSKRNPALSEQEPDEEKYRRADIKSDRIPPS
ncbi:MAG: hypothetical protein Q8882_04160 [Bacillota bacterium]|nr:hypothetical protein [Bacillota bacterium]